jgi:hypothetical protein
MSVSFWRRLWNSRPGLSSGCRVPEKEPSSRLRLEPLEDRLLPALGVGGLPVLAVGGIAPAAVAGKAPSPTAAAASNTVGPSSSRGANQIAVTVDVGASPTVIDLGAVFAKMNNLRCKDGLQLALLGNTNSGLVKTGLSEAALTLTFAPGKVGKATITVSATDADGVCVQETVLVTVLPKLPAGTGGGSPLVAGGKASTSVGPSR